MQSRRDTKIFFTCSSLVEIDHTCFRPHGPLPTPTYTAFSSRGVVRNNTLWYTPLLSTTTGNKRAWTRGISFCIRKGSCCSCPQIGSTLPARDEPRVPCPLNIAVFINIFQIRMYIPLNSCPYALLLCGPLFTAARLVRLCSKYEYTPANSKEIPGSAQHSLLFE